MKSKENCKKVVLHVRISKEDYDNLLSYYRTFNNSFNTHISFSEFLRRLLFTSKMEC